MKCGVMAISRVVWPLPMDHPNVTAMEAAKSIEPVGGVQVFRTQVQFTLDEVLRTGGLHVEGLEELMRHEGALVFGGFLSWCFEAARRGWRTTVEEYRMMEVGVSGESESGSRLGSVDLDFVVNRKGRIDERMDEWVSKIWGKNRVHRMRSGKFGEEQGCGLMGWNDIGLLVRVQFTRGPGLFYVRPADGQGKRVMVFGSSSGVHRGCFTKVRPGVVGKVMVVNGKMYNVVGVGVGRLGFLIRNGYDRVWVPTCAD